MYVFDRYHPGVRSSNTTDLYQITLGEKGVKKVHSAPLSRHEVIQIYCLHNLVIMIFILHGQFTSNINYTELVRKTNSGV